MGINRVLFTTGLPNGGRSATIQEFNAKAPTLSLVWAHTMFGETQYFFGGYTLIATPDWKLPAGTNVNIGGRIYKTTTDMDWLAQVNALGEYEDAGLAGKLIEWGYIREA